MGGRAATVTERWGGPRQRGPNRRPGPVVEEVAKGRCLGLGDPGTKRHLRRERKQMAGKGSTIRPMMGDEGRALNPDTMGLCARSFRTVEGRHGSR